MCKIQRFKDYQWEIHSVEYFGSEFNYSWSEYDIEHGNDKPWLCHMPNVIGTIAVVIALGSMFTVLYNFASYVKENAKLRRNNSFDLTETTRLTRLSTTVIHPQNGN